MEETTDTPVTGNDASESPRAAALVPYLRGAIVVLGAALLWAMTNGVWGSAPQWSAELTWWIRWMVTIGMTSAIFAFSHTSARWVLGAYLTNHAVAIGLGVSGLVPFSDGLINLTHVVFWTPAVVVLARALGGLDRRSIYAVWHVLALATMSISLLFDYRDAFRYLFM